MANSFKQYRQLELKSINSNFSFSKEMQKASMNSLWKNKEGLWTLLSGICDDAAVKCYEKINNLVTEVADIETCNINSLISIAKSVDASFLVDDLKKINDEDQEVVDLINLFSVQKDLLLSSNEILSQEANDKQYGAIMLRSSALPLINVNIDLLFNIKKYILNIKELFKINLIDIDKKIIDLLYYDLPDLKLNKYKFYDNIVLSYNLLKNIQNMTDLEVLNMYSLRVIFDEIVKIPSDKLIFYKNQKIFIYIDNVKHINYFYILINVIKQNYYNQVTGSFILTSYFDKSINSNIDLFRLISSIVGTIYHDDESYLNNFICFHFYGLFIDKLKNSKIRNLFNIKNDKLFIKNDVENDMSKDEFISNLSEVLDFKDIQQFIETNNIKKYKIEFVDFVKFINKLNSLNLNSDVKLFTIDNINIPYQIFQIVFSDLYKNNNHEDILYGLKNYSSLVSDQFKNLFKLNENNHVIYSKELDDLLNITNYLNDDLQDYLNNNINNVTDNNKIRYINFLKKLKNRLSLSINEISNILNIISIKNDNSLLYIDDSEKMISLISEYIYVKKILFKYNLYDFIDVKNFKIYDIFYNVNENFKKVNNILNFLNLGIIYILAKKYTNLCIKIRYIRELIKNIVQQYSFIGTKRVVTDILFDYFVKNFSEKKDWNYLTNDSFITDDESSLKRPMTDLLNGTTSISKNNIFYKNDDEFSIDVIEYYDSTKYLNIKSEVPKINIGKTIIGFNNVTSAYIDDDYSVKFVENKVPIYESVYKSADLYIKNYNNKFWKNNLINLNNANKVEDSIIEHNLTYYNNFFKNDDDIISVEYDEIYKNKIKSLLHKIWDTFSLSGIIDDNIENDTPINNLYKKYLYSNGSIKRYENFGNDVFPTIAPLQNFDGLLKISDYDENYLLFVAKVYYKNVYDKLKIALNDMIKDLDINGIPDNGWKQSYITFNGYSTDYEYSDNKLLYSTKVSKLYKVNGPFVYSDLKLFLLTFYEKLDGSLTKEKYEDFISNIFTNTFASHYGWELDNIIIEKYKTYFSYENNLKNEILPSIICNNDILDLNTININHRILTDYLSQYEEDIYNNCYSLYKHNKNDVFGKIWFRSYNMPISLPLIIDKKNHMFSEKTSTNLLNILNSVCNNCFEFGIFYNTFWAFGKFKDVNNNELPLYCLFSCSFKFKNNIIEFDESTLHLYNFDSHTKYLSYFNNYVGSFYQNDCINFILFNIENELISLSNNIDDNNVINKSEELFSTELIFDIISYDVYNNKIFYDNLKIPKKYDVIFPAILEWDDSKNIFSDIIFDKQRIWTLNVQNDICNIGYMSINKDILDMSQSFETLYSYFNFKSYRIDIEMFGIKWPNKKYKINNDFYMFNSYENEDISLYKNKSKVIYLNTNMTLEEKVEKFKLLYSKISNSYIKDQYCYNEFGPLSFGYNFTKEFEDKLIKTILTLLKNNKKYNNTISFKLIQDILNPNLINDVDNESKFLIKEINYLINYNQWKLNKTYESYEFEILSNIVNYIKIMEENNTNEIIIANEETLNNESLFSRVGQYYQEIPALISCCVDPLKISIFFNQNLSNPVKFLNDGVIDLDITCYINDIFESKNKVGYGNNFRQTKYISWYGDETNGGHEDIKIDINKYIIDTSLNDTINTDFEIVFNLCWNENSQITPSNLYALINWENLVENININLVGNNSLSCNTHSFSIVVNRNTKNISIYKNKLYGILKLNYKEELEGYDGIPDIEFGLLNCNDYTLPKIKEKFKKILYISNIFEFNEGYYYEHKNQNSISFIFPNTYFIEYNDYNAIINLYKTMLLKLSSRNVISEKTFNEAILKDYYFDEKYGNFNEINGIMNYVIFLNPLYFSNMKNFKYKVENVFNPIFKKSNANELTIGTMESIANIININMDEKVVGPLSDILDIEMINYNTLLDNSASRLELDLEINEYQNYESLKLPLLINKKLNLTDFYIIKRISTYRDSNYAEILDDNIFNLCNNINDLVNERIIYPINKILEISLDCIDKYKTLIDENSSRQDFDNEINKYQEYKSNNLHNIRYKNNLIDINYVEKRITEYEYSNYDEILDTNLNKLFELINSNVSEKLTTPINKILDISKNNNKLIQLSLMSTKEDFDNALTKYQQVKLDNLSLNTNKNNFLSKTYIENRIAEYEKLYYDEILK